MGDSGVPHLWNPPFVTWSVNHGSRRTRTWRVAGSVWCGWMAVPPSGGSWRRRRTNAPRTKTWRCSWIFTDVHRFFIVFLGFSAISMDVLWFSWIFWEMVDLTNRKSGIFSMDLAWVKHEDVEFICRFYHMRISPRKTWATWVSNCSCRDLTFLGNWIFRNESSKNDGLSQV